MIKLSSGGFTLIPEGTTILKITEVEYKKDFGKLNITMQTKSGEKHTERFSLINGKGEVNEGALNAFSFFARKALQTNASEIDEQELVGCYIKATVKHEEFESNKEPGKMLKSARLNNYDEADGFEGVSEDQEDIDEDIDLDDFLND